MARLYREFRRNCPTVLTVEKIRSVFLHHRPREEKSVALPGNAKITYEDTEQPKVIHVVHIYFSLRVLANAAAKAGNYQVDSKVTPGTRVRYAPLDVNLDPGLRR